MIDDREIKPAHVDQIYRNKEDIIVLKINQQQLLDEANERKERDEKYDKKFDELLSSQIATTTQLKILFGTVSVVFVPFTLALLSYLLDTYGTSR